MYNVKHNIIEMLGYFVYDALGYGTNKSIFYGDLYYECTKTPYTAPQSIRLRQEVRNVNETKCFQVSN